VQNALAIKDAQQMKLFLDARFIFGSGDANIHLGPGFSC